MEDEHQSTLKKKIQILFQLGKWPDVVKLCASYNEQYGKDMEIDMLRFKSERHLGISSPGPGGKPEEPKPESKPEARAERPLAAILEMAEPAPGQAPKGPQAPSPGQSPKGTSPMGISASGAASPAPAPGQSHEGTGHGARSPEGTSRLEAGRPPLEEKPLEIAPSPAEEITIGDPFAEDELVITDPFAEDGPGFSLAPDEPPVDVGSGEAPHTVIPSSPALELEGPADSPPAPAQEEPEIDFSKFGGLSIDAEPELFPSRPAEPPARPISPEREAEKLEDFAPPARERVDIVEEPREEMATYAPTRGSEERTRPASSLFTGIVPEEKPKRRWSFSLKHALLVVLPLVAAAALWLALTGRLNFTGAPEEVAASQPPVERPSRRPTAPVKVEAPPPVAPVVDEQEKAFAQKFQQAEELHAKGDLLKAWAVVLEAKKIKVTEPLRLLEEQLAGKIRAAEEKAKQATQVAENQMQLESDAFARAEAANTIAAWQDFIKKYPEGELALRAGRRIAQLEKKAQEDSQQVLRQRVRQMQRVQLRSGSLSLNQAEIAAMVRQLGRPATQFEAHEHGGARVMLDFASGLMWTLWSKPMVYDKAKWWSNRVTAGYSGWRLPTCEEALSLLQMDRGLFAGLADFAVWTTDMVSDQPRSVWVLKIPEGQFLSRDYDQSYYVWAVRKAGR